MCLKYSRTGPEFKIWCTCSWKVTFLMTNLKIKSSFNSFIFVTFIFLLLVYLNPSKSKDFILCEQDQYVVGTSSCRNTFIQIHMLLYYSSGAHKMEKTFYLHLRMLYIGILLFWDKKTCSAVYFDSWQEEFIIFTNIC